MSDANAPRAGARLGLTGIAYHLDEQVPIEQIPLLAGDARLLAAFKAGGHAHFARARLSRTEQAIAAARRTLEQAALHPQEIDAVVIGSSEFRDWVDRYPEMVSTEILLGLGLKDLPVIGVTLAGCANCASSLRVARNMLVAEGLAQVLVIETNRVPHDAERPYVSPLSGFAGAIFSDGAVSFIATTRTAEFAVLGMQQTVKPIDKQKSTLQEVLANDVDGYREVFAGALQRAGLATADLEAVFLPNVHIAAVEGWAAATGVPPQRVFRENIARTAHVWSADGLIGLRDYCGSRPVAPGANFLLLSQAESYYSAIVCSRQ